MARLPAIIEILAKHDSRSAATITNYARVLREAGYLPKGKRGRGAAHLKPTEVADLVIGLAAASDAVVAPRAVQILENAALKDMGWWEGALDGPVEIESYLSEWSVKEMSHDLKSLIASLLYDAPTRLVDGIECPATNITVQFDEVPPDSDLCSVYITLDDGNEYLTFGYSTSPSIEDAMAAISGDSLGHKTWSRQTTISYSFFAAISQELNASGGEGEPDE